MFLKNEYSTQSGFKKKLYCNYFQNLFSPFFNPTPFVFFKDISCFTFFAHVQPKGTLFIHKSE